MLITQFTAILLNEFPVALDSLVFMGFSMKLIHDLDTHTTHSTAKMLYNVKAKLFSQVIVRTKHIHRNDFHFKHDFSCLPEIMSWDEYAFTKGKMSFIAQDFNNLNIITVLEGRTQAVIRDHFLKYDRAVRCQVKIIELTNNS
ncbi:IS1167, transposase [Streptococcus pneumoniae]|nr:IS1167, transposase [Streptococcus pneumoniae]VSY42009.1 IS1167, transposase [Streptococcus pneumoniae]